MPCFGAEPTADRGATPRRPPGRDRAPARPRRASRADPGSRPTASSRPRVARHRDDAVRLHRHRRRVAGSRSARDTTTSASSKHAFESVRVPISYATFEPCSSGTIGASALERGLRCRPRPAAGRTRRSPARPRRPPATSSRRRPSRRCRRRTARRSATSGGRLKTSAATSRSRVDRAGRGRRTAYTRDDTGHLAAPRSTSSMLDARRARSSTARTRRATARRSRDRRSTASHRRRTPGPPRRITGFPRIDPDVAMGPPAANAAAA